jgi:hypothetical protein
MVPGKRPAAPPGNSLVQLCCPISQKQTISQTRALILKPMIQGPFPGIFGTLGRIPLVLCDKANIVIKLFLPRSAGNRQPALSCPPCMTDSAPQPAHPSQSDPSVKH